jgi:hypothetical protein
MPHSQALFDIETLANHVIGNGDPAVSGADKNRRKISRETLRMELIGFNDDRMTRQKLSQFIFRQLAIGLVWAPHFGRVVAFETHGDPKMDVETKVNVKLGCIAIDNANDECVVSVSNLGN